MVCPHFKAGVDGFPIGLPNSRKDLDLFVDVNNYFCNSCTKGGFTTIQDLVSFQETRKVGYKQLFLHLRFFLSVHQGKFPELTWSDPGEIPSITQRMSSLLLGRGKTRRSSAGSTSSNSLEAVEIGSSEPIKDPDPCILDDLVKKHEGDFSFPLVPMYRDKKWVLYSLGTQI